MTTTTWAKVANGKTRVTIGVGTVAEKRFTLDGIALTATDIVKALDDASGAIRVRSKKQSCGQDASGNGGAAWTVGGEQNPADLASEFRKASGLPIPAAFTAKQLAAIAKKLGVAVDAIDPATGLLKAGTGIADVATPPPPQGQAA